MYVYVYIYIYVCMNVCVLYQYGGQAHPTWKQCLSNRKSHQHTTSNEGR